MDERGQAPPFLCSLPFVAGVYHNRRCIGPRASGTLDPVVLDSHWTSLPRAWSFLFNRWPQGWPPRHLAASSCDGKVGDELREHERALVGGRSSLLSPRSLVHQRTGISK